MTFGFNLNKNTNTPITQDGSLGAQTIKALQVALGFTGSDVDGALGPNTILRLQWFLNLGGIATGNPPTLGSGASAGVVSSAALDEKTGVSYARYSGGGTVASWIASACAARGVTGSAAVQAWTTGYQTAISRESSGDANACNTNDLNDVTPAGYQMVADWGTGYGNPSGNLNGQLVNYRCSRGVAQCIPPTFAAYHCPNTSNMIYDPVANIAASMGYVMSQYGVASDGHNLASLVEQFDPSRPARGY